MKKIDKLTIFLMPIGVAVNFIGGQLTMMLKLPVFLDAIGTILVGALCGGVPGAIVGVVSNIISSISWPAYMWYGIINLCYGFLAAYLSKKKVFKTAWKAALSSVLFALIGGTLNTCITWIVFGSNFSTDATGLFATMVYVTFKLPKFFSFMTAAICMDVLDKLLSVMIVFFILKSMPNRFLVKLRLGENYIKQ